MNFDIAAVFLCVSLIVLYIMGRSYPSKSNIIYIALVILTLLAALFNFLTVFDATSGSNVPVWANYLFNILYLLSYNILNIMFFVYIVSITKGTKVGNGDRLFVLLTSLVDIFMISTSPVNRFVFSISESGVYSRGPGMYVVYMIAVLVFVADFTLYIFYHKRLNRTQSIAIILMLVLSVTCVLLQFNIDGLYIAHFALALTELLIYVYLQNPFMHMSRRTMCYNAAAFYDSVESKISCENPFGVAVFVIDEQEYINNVFGGKTIDGLSYVLTRHLTERFGRRRVFILGDCAFAILNNGTGIPDERVLKDIRTFFKAPVRVGDNIFSLTPRLSIVRYPDFVKSVKDVKAAVEYAMSNERKEIDKDVVANGSIVDSKLREANILHIMKRALANGGFEVFYQPIYCVKSGKFSIAEALIRLKDEELGYISPEEFIVIAERNGLIMKIGEFVVESVCKFLVSEQAADLDIKTVEVNLSVVQCMQPNLADSIIGIMHRYGISGDRIIFEVTETARYTNADALANNMNKLVAYGCSFALDDYGTGFSTAKYLVSLPVDMVKIDKSILWAAMKNPSAMTVLRYTMGMLNSLNMRIVVEGVETQEMISAVLPMDCDYMQGFYYSRPLSVERYMQFMRENK